MKIFISWSGEDTKPVAEKLKTWLPDVIQSLDPWASFENIGAGDRWGPEMSRALEESEFGILCLTAKNQADPWILFEAGALSKRVKQGRVCPYLLGGMMPKDMSGGPLTQFQAKVADRERTFELVQSLNTALDAAALPLETLKRQFDRVWPELEKVLSAPLAAHPVAPKRDTADTLGEILEIARELKRNSVVSKQSIANELMRRVNTIFATDAHEPKLPTAQDTSSVFTMGRASYLGGPSASKRIAQGNYLGGPKDSLPPLQQGQAGAGMSVPTEESVPAKNTDRKEKPKRRRK